MLYDDTIYTGGGGPSIEGRWSNPKTGDSFTAKDTYFEGDQLYIITMDGRRINGDMLSDYVQVGSECSDTNVMNYSYSNNTSSINEDILELEREAQQELLNKIIPQETTNYQAQANTNNQSYIDEDELLIKRMLSKSKEPIIKTGITWTFPDKQIDMLDCMGVEHDKIADFYINKLDINRIRESLKKEIISYIHNKLNTDNKEKSIETLIKKDTKKKK